MLFSELAACYQRLEGISSRIAMVGLLAEVFAKAGAGEASKIVYMTQGMLAPPFEGIEFGVAEKLAQEAIARATGAEPSRVESVYKKYGDMGIAAETMKAGSRLKPMISAHLSVSDVYARMRAIAAAGGPGSKEQKVRMLSELVAAATPLEARYLVRYPLGELRLGVGDATILEALALMSSGERGGKRLLEAAYNICSDLGEIAESVKKKGLKGMEGFDVTLFKPIRPALAERMQTAEQIIERIGRCAAELKYDGFRCQVHKRGNEVRIYSRRLEDTTEMYPDLVSAVREEAHARDAIFDGEALAFNEATEEFMPFQQTMQRKRKHSIEAKAAELPLRLFCFDIMFLNGRSLINEPYATRRATLESLLKGSSTIMPTRMRITGRPAELDAFFQESVANGLEGIMAKDLNAPYTAGVRKFAWIKMKRSYKNELSDTLDLVVVGYFLGRGSRASLRFGGLLCATYNPKRDMFETVSKIGTGFTEAQMSDLRAKLAPTQTRERPVRVDSLIEPDFWTDPRFVVTVMADEITRSQLHTCGMRNGESGDASTAGYALRFPRIVGDPPIRKDKGPEEATTTHEVVEMYMSQRKVRSDSA